LSIAQGRIQQAPSNNVFANPFKAHSRGTPHIRAHWEWAGGYAMFWIVVTLLIFGGVYAVLDYLAADENVRTQSFVVLAAITLLNAIWRAIGALAARIALMSKTKHN
jgi:predicted metal-binding membrane protein